MGNGRGTRRVETGDRVAERDASTSEDELSALVVFRADGNAVIGGGHIMRSLSLASVFAEGGWKIGFAASAESFKSMPQLNASGYEKLVLPDDAAGEAAAMMARWPEGCDVLVIDHYGRGAGFEQSLRAWAKRIAVIDDLANREHDADVLTDSSALSAASYQGLVPESCRVLAGPSIAIVHPGFVLARDVALPRRDGRKVSRILVSFGQVDPENATALALDAIELSGFAGAVDVVLGQAAPNLSAIRRRAKHRVTLHVNASNMPALMATSDFSIGAGGTTAFERCCVGLPALVVEIAENQQGVIRALTAARAIESAGPRASVTKETLADILKALLSDSAKLAAMAATGAALVDGRGAERVFVAAIGEEKSKDGRAVRVRVAEEPDEAWLLDLQAKPETRLYSSNPTAPTAEEHAAWFAKTRKDPTRLLMIVEADGKAAGMLRLDRRPENHIVNIAVDPAFHRSGIGAAALRLASRISPGKTLLAQVHEGNAASLALFSAEGYRHDDGTFYKREPK
jgi:UDP-2,4-diacetamido-2,4,6-trideoxy-beta-L-altropyranose hydrolase